MEKSRFVRVVAVLLCVPLMIMLSSCVRMKATYEIKSETEADVSIDMGMLKSAADQGGQSRTKESMCEGDGGLASPTKGVKNAKAEPYDDGEYIGCKVTGTAQISELEVLTLKDDVWTFDMKSGDSSGSGEDASLFTDFKVSVKFPGKVLTHNGSSTVQGTTVTWTDPKDIFTSEGLKATAEHKSGLPVWLWPLLGFLVLALAAAAMFFVLRQRKRKAVAAQQAQAQQWSGQQNQWQQGPGQDQQYGQNQPQQWNQYHGNQQWQGQPQGQSQWQGGQPQGHQQWQEQQPQQWQANEQFGHPGEQSQQWGGQQSADGWRDPWQAPESQSSANSQPSSNQWQQQSQPSSNPWQGDHHNPGDGRPPQQS